MSNICLGVQLCAMTSQTAKDPSWMLIVLLCAALTRVGLVRTPFIPATALIGKLSTDIINTPDTIYSLVPFIAVCATTHTALHKILLN